MKAIVLAAGEGKRLRPFTETMPKVMLPVANKPILEHVFDAVKQSGIDEIIVVVGYKKEVIMEYFEDYKGIKITYVVQDKQLGTAHALLQAKKYIKTSFLVLSGDNIIDRSSISKLIKEKSEYSILIKEHPHPSKYGVVFIEKGNVTGIVEKPREEIGRFISTGIYKLPKKIFERVEKSVSQGVYALSSTVQTILDDGEEIKTVIANSWMDVVYPWDILSVNESMVHNISSSTNGTIEKGVTIKGNVSIGKDTKIHSGSYIVGPVVIGKSCEIGPNACIFPSTTIGNNSIINPFSEIRNSVIMDNVRISSNSSVLDSIVGRGSNIGNNFSSISGKTTVEMEGEIRYLENIGVMIGEDCNIESHVVSDPGVIIGRKCSISPVKRISKDIPSKTKVM